MSTVAQVMVAIGADGVPDVLNALKQVEGAVVKVGKTSQSTGKQMSDIGKSGSNALVEFGQKWQGAVGMITTAAIPAMAVIKGVKAAIDFSQEGALIDYTRQKFDRLALSIGTTGNALRDDLVKASRGVKSEFELTSLASEMMSLKLAKNHKDLVRLSSVASALNMDMNQLALALANKSTQRLDQLGLSVEAVTAKMAELKKAGMSEAAAYFGAIVSSAEDVIKTQGHAADANLGMWQKMKAAQTDYFNGLKEDLAEATSGWAVFWDGVFRGADEAADFRKASSQLKKEQKDLFEYFSAYSEGFHPVKDMAASIEFGNTRDAIAGLIDPRQIREALGGTYQNAEEIARQRTDILRQYEKFLGKDMGFSDAEIGKRIAETYKKIGESMFAGNMTQQWADLNDRVYKYVKNTNLASEAMTEFASSFESIVSLSTNFGGIVKLATQYDGILGKIGDASARIKELEPFKETGGYIDGVWMSATKVKKELEGLEGVVADGQAAMKRMADQMTLDMLQATIAIGGVTQAEAETYFNMAADMGLISREAADAAIAAYQNAVETISGLTIDPITGEILGNADHFWTVFDQVRIAKIAEIIIPILGDLEPLKKDFSYVEWIELKEKIVKVLADSGMAEEEIARVNLWELAKKIGLVELDSDLAKAQFNEINSWGFNEKRIKVVFEGGYGPPAPVKTGGFTSASVNAIGGAVYPNKPYTWQEPGREGELLVTEKYGRVMSNHEVAMAIRDAIIGAGNAIGGQAGAPSTTNQYTYNINAQYKEEPVLTLSEHLSILRTLEGMR